MKGIMRRAAKALSKISTFLWLLILVWLIGVILIFVAFADSGLWLLSLGFMLVSGISVAAVYKSHVAATEVRLMSRELRSAFLTSQEDRNDSRIQRSQLSLSVAPRGTSSGKSVRTKSGQGENTPACASHCKPRVAVIGTPTLKEHLSSVAEVTSLHPGISEALFEVEKPSALVLEEVSLLRGSWKSDLSASGHSLLNEIFRLSDTVIKHNLPLYVVPSTRGGASIQRVRDNATIVLNDAYISGNPDMKRAGSSDGKLFEVVSHLFDYAFCKDRVQ